jgi:hypothetical protein
MILKKKKYLLVFFVILVFLGLTFLFLNNKSFSKKEVSLGPTLPTEAVIPTVDSSVKVEFKPLKKGEVALTISNEPKGTEAIDFELTYKTLNNDILEGGEGGAVEQGVIGKCFKTERFWQCGEEGAYGGRKIVLGTCSSGTCRYHNVLGPVKLNLKFTGIYGEKIYEKEFKI